MIGFLRGTLLDKQPPFITLDVNGVGYELEVPMTTLFQLPASGQSLELHTHLVVRDDAQLLFGFYTRQDRQMFRELIRLKGVGPKLALALMSGMSAEELIACVQAEDIKQLTTVPGVGKRTAERLLVELKGKFKDWDARWTAPAGRRNRNITACRQCRAGCCQCVGQPGLQAGRSQSCSACGIC